MKRAAAGIVGCAVLAVAGTAAGAAAGAGPAQAAAPRAQLVHYACVRALDPANRSISAQAVMRAVPGTRRLQMKFELLVRQPAAAGTGAQPPQSSQSAVRAGDLGVWISPADPTLGQRPGDVWRVNKTVLNLAAPAWYRLRVRFRWTGTRGRVLATAVRRTRVCGQPERRPDLLVRSLTVAPVPGHPGQDLYTAVIANDGRTGAGPFEVLFAPGDSALAVTRTVRWLGGHRARQMTFQAPACDAADPPTLTVDAAAQVDDFDRANNEMAAACPAPS